MIRICFNSEAVFYSRHAMIEMKNEELGKIFEHEVYEAVCTGEVIEEYPDDRPYPSVLIYGRTINDRPLHVVCACNNIEKLVIMVTVYQPKSELWVDYKRRKGP